MTNGAVQAVTAGTMRTTADCGFSVSSVMGGGAWIAVGSRISSLTSAGTVSATRPQIECSTSFATDTTAANVTYMRTTKYPSRTGRTCDSISTTCGRDATAVIGRRHCVRPEGPVGRSNLYLSLIHISE